MSGFFIHSGGEYVCFYNTSSGERIIASRTLGLSPRIIIGGNTLIPDYTGAIPNINGKIVYAASSGHYVWYSIEWGWVYTTGYPFQLLSEYWNQVDPYLPDEGGVYGGSAFATIGSATGMGIGGWSIASTTKAYARGSGRGTTYGGEGPSLDVSFSFPRWLKSSTEYGLYEPTAGASGNLYFGCPRWSYSGTYYDRSPTQAYNGHYKYGTIEWDTDAGKFVLGTYGHESGWHEASSDPSSGSSWTLQFAKPEGSEAEGSNITLSWNSWVLGSLKNDTHVFRSEAKWSIPE
jgi:hypothetical protein